MFFSRRALADIACITNCFNMFLFQIRKRYSFHLIQVIMKMEPLKTNNSHILSLTDENDS